MDSPTPEQQLAQFVTDLAYDDLSGKHVETVVRAFVDTVGVALAGSVEGAGRTAAETGDISPDDADVSTLLGIDGPESPEMRALRVGTASHALDYDDLSWGLDGHPSVTLVPPILALAAETEASGRDVIAAFAAGFETECAVAQPISPEHYEDGWHATATFGTFGATAAAAHLLGLDADRTRTALDIAVSMPSGLKRNFGSMTKPLHAGLCARSGVTAARLARNGFTAGATAISGERGFWDLYGHEERSEFSIGDGWHLDDDGIHVKAYPCCYFTHTAIAATQDLARDVDPETIERVTVEAAPGAGDALTNPDPTTGLEAKFSMEYAVGSALARDRVGLETFRDDTIDDPEIRRFSELVSFSVDETLPYDSHEAVVRIETTDGEYEQRRVNPPGTHDSPLDEADFRAKFEECAGTVLEDSVTDDLYDALSTLSEQSSVRAVLSPQRS